MNGVGGKSKTLYQRFGREARVSRLNILIHISLPIPFIKIHQIRHMIQNVELVDKVYEEIENQHICE